MKACLFTYTSQGVQTSLRIQECLKADWDCQIFAPQRFSNHQVQALSGSLEEATGSQWNEVDAFIFVSATGVAVRAIAPFIKDKTIDPAVICVDVAGTYAISLLSGHIGGGNQLARRIAMGIDALQVITTATDINRRFAVDEWAKQKGFEISSMQAAKAVSAAILEGDVSFKADADIWGLLPPGLSLSAQLPVGVMVSVSTREPFPCTLRLIPKVLTLGIGCRKGASEQQIDQAVQTVFDRHQLDMRAVKQAASIDIKQEEEGLLSFCNGRGISIAFYPSQQLNGLSGAFTASGFVKSITGVDNVCERAALMRGGALIVPKTAVDGVTVAVSEASWEVRFE